uniref:Uncharacterized protein LOC102804169 n=1 Tax=Saccoglossus kowalevskii TaxID=10224 RepID=A0ABM0M8E1_SACKO
AAFHFQQGGPEDRHDPYSSSNVKSTNVHIKQQMEFAISQQDYVSVFRWILIRSLVNKQYNLLADCWRLLHSTAYQIEYIMELNKSMQDLIISDLETTGTLAAAQERKRHPPPPDPNKPKKANQEEPPPPPPPEERVSYFISTTSSIMFTYVQNVIWVLWKRLNQGIRKLKSTYY